LNYFENTLGNFQEKESGRGSFPEPSEGEELDTSFDFGANVGKPFVIPVSDEEPMPF